MRSTAQGATVTGPVISRSGASYAVRRARTWLPSGRSLPEHVWRSRHRGIVRLLLLHIPALVGIGALNGSSVSSSILLTVPLGVAAVVASLTLLGDPAGPRPPERRLRPHGRPDGHRLTGTSSTIGSRRYPMTRFQVREGEHPGDASAQYAVVDTANDDLPVARFASRDDAQAHAEKLEQGPLDWDEQDAWKDDWDDDDWDDASDGARP